ncbi:hypothetical protein L873DRAFT_1934946 [Choiromyces venosus 120613-1]|uniref:Uncharacterized protein n=1 Tax=Choiromyces venosus 120613-1 TaxID=1336337 RepID=A0A3N4J9A6_9PEZI|nr:hypothetical protein L873DRAFT_1934946 [Choiromyces venosus 120613-1]
MDSGLGGQVITPLPQMTEFDITEISSYITRALHQFDTQDAYGIFEGVHQLGGPIVPTLKFGLSRSNLVEIVLPPPPNNLPIGVREDSILSMNELGAKWATGSIAGAGSFRGFLKRSSILDKLFGITAAAHCVPGALVGMPVCSPSTIEVTGRLKRLLRYTLFCPLTNHLHVALAKVTKALALLEQLQFHDDGSGMSFLDPHNQIQLKTGILSGGNLGVIVSYHFGTHSELLHRYYQELRRGLIPHFSTTVSWPTRIDWSIFTCNLGRYDANLYEGDRISEIWDLYPRAKVEKIGCSARENGAATYEIAIIGPVGENFANRGDSGGCMFVYQDGTYKASGLLIGQCQQSNITVATPLHFILLMDGDYKWA